MPCENATALTRARRLDGHVCDPGPRRRPVVWYAPARRAPDRASAHARAGYVSSGFFGGLTLGRVVLLPLNHALGERNAVFAYSAVALALDVVIWRVRSLVGDAVALAGIGLVLGAPRACGTRALLMLSGARADVPDRDEPGGLRA
jgi:hypothetical protein